MSEHEHPNPNPQDDPSSTPLVMGAAIGGLVTLATIIACAALYFQNEKKFTNEIRYDPMAGSRIAVAQLKGDQQMNLAGKVAWVDKSKGTIERLPMDQAIRLSISEGGKHKTNAAGSQPTAGPNSAAAKAADAAAGKKP